MEKKLFLRLWRVITPRRRLQLFALLGFTFLASLAEVVSIGSVLPLIAVLTSPEKVYNNEFVRPIIDVFGIAHQELAWLITLLFCCAAAAAALVRTIAIWLRTRLSFEAGADLSEEVYRRTLHQPYLVHLSRSSSEVIDAISSKITIVIFDVLQPLIITLSNVIMLVIILLALLLYQPLITLIACGSFGLIYSIIYLVARKRLQANSRDVATNSTLRIKSLQEGLGGIRDVLLNNSQNVYCAEYQQTDRRLRRAQADNNAIGEVPRFAIEASGMILIALITLYMTQGPEGFEVVLPFVGALALASQRLLPLLQQIYNASVALKGSQHSLEDTLSLLEQPLFKTDVMPDSASIKFQHSIVCKELGFRYPKVGSWVFRNLDLSINKGSRVGVVGTTGSGKSTLMDLLMGLLQPSEGELLVDGNRVTAANASQWQCLVAHVPQTIYLSDASVAENIAFGVPRKLIDMARVRRVAEQAQIASTVEGWHDGYETLVGERGAKLSGGQRQRIGIARALYKNAEVLIFDEATSALDTLTEEGVMKAILGLDRSLTVIIVAHRLSTLSGCDFVISLTPSEQTFCSIPS